MRSDVYGLAVAVAAFAGGLALFVAGFVLALEVRSVVATPGEAPMAQLPNPGHSYDQIELPAGTWPALDADLLDGYEASDFGGGGGCYTNWNGNTCASGWTAVSTGVWTAVAYSAGYYAGTLICAQEKAYTGHSTGFLSDVSNESANGGHAVNREPCAICCK